MKHVLNILPATLFAVALMLLYYAHEELKINQETLEWRMNNKTQQLDAMIKGCSHRIYLDRQAVAQLETDKDKRPIDAVISPQKK
ncbi:MAG TPA: hypothetical protein VGN23_05365 [Verrucomicrobiae bacterium]|jgi:hypothetical protein